MEAWIEITDEDGTVQRWHITEDDARFAQLENVLGTPDTTIL